MSSNASNTPAPENKTTTAEESASNQSPHQGTGFFSMIKSIVGGMFGVQSEAQREKDFQQGNATQFIIGGIIFTLIFIFTILYFVNSALESAG